jgi:alkylation response protein AidB-like acyl-CoA dehydrogenase
VLSEEGRVVTDPVGRLQDLTRELLANHDPAGTDRLDFLHARFAAGLAWVHYPAGFGGLGLDRVFQSVVDELLAGAGVSEHLSMVNQIGLGMAAPTLLEHGTDDQKRRFLRPLWTGEEVWCQLFSEPGAGSDLAGVATRAVRDGDDWVVNGQKVWTSVAHLADYAILLARTDPDVPKHAGLTYFVCDMRTPGVEVRPLRQITGEAEFNEVFLTDVRIPDAYRVGAVGQGWKVASTTLNHERVAIGGNVGHREGGLIGVVASSWRARADRRSPGLQDRLVRLWIEAEVLRLSGLRLRQKVALGQPGPEGSSLKVAYARVNQELAGLELELLAEDGLRYDGWPMSRPVEIDLLGRHAGYRYLRAKGNSIEGGTSEILRNLVAERVLGLPAEHRPDKGIAWKDTPR